jgi:protoporphyrinogen/coproporphyrinogen III oxidase
MSRHIAVLGGGLTGLSAAFHLTRKFPAARITLLEKSSRLGGWVQSERQTVDDDKASVVLEGGPRTLRTAGKSVQELVGL